MRLLTSLKRVEVRMLQALKEGRDWKQGNTEVRAGSVYLNGAPLVKDGVINAAYFRENPSALVASRLRALGYPAHRVEGRAAIAGVVIEGDEG